MKNNKREPLLSQLAEQYLEEDGRRLLEEAEKLEESASSPLPAVDGRVRSFRAARRRGRYAAAFGAVAAGLLLLFLLPRLDSLSPASDAPLTAYSDEPAAAREPHTAQPPDADAPAKGEAIPQDGKGGSASASLAMEEAAAPAPAAAPEALDAVPAEEAAEAELQQAPSDAAVSEAVAKAPAPSPAIIPLSFTLPAGFTVDSVRQDRGETIYHLANAALDDVVLSVADAADAPLATDGLVAVSGASGDTAYGLSGGDVQFLTFVRDGLRYRLTCRHDIQTLLSLWQHIASA